MFFLLIHMLLYYIVPKSGNSLVRAKYSYKGILSQRTVVI